MHAGICECPLLSLHTPPRLVPTPGTLADWQHAAVEQSKMCKNAVTEVHFLQKWLPPKSALRKSKYIKRGSLRPSYAAPSTVRATFAAPRVRTRGGAPVVLASLARARLTLKCSRASRRLSADAVGRLARGI